MTAAHLPGAILTPRNRGARAVASFTKPDATQAAKRSATASPSSFREAATPNGDPAGRLGDGIVRPAFVAHLATRGCEKEARVVPAIRGANFNAADARSRATHLRAGWSPSAETHPCNRRCRSIGPEMPARRSSARPAEPFNAASNERSSEPGRCLVSSEAPGCRGDAYTLPSPCEMTTHCMAKANAGVGGRHGCTRRATDSRTKKPAGRRALRENNA